MSKLVLTLTIIVLFSFSNAQPKDINDRIFDNIIGLRVNDYNSFEKLLNTSDITYFAYYYKRSSKNSRLIAIYIESIAKKLEHIAKIVLVDCDKTFNKPQYCLDADPSVDTFPRMRLFFLPEQRFNPYTKENYPYNEISWSEDKVNEARIYNFITKNIPSYTVKLNYKTLDDFLNKNRKINKILLFTKQKTTPLMYKGLSNLFLERILLGEVHESETEIVKKFNIQKFPTLISFVTIDEDNYVLDNAIVGEYQGEIKISDTKDFIEKFALEQKFGNENNKVPRRKDLIISITRKEIDGFLLRNSKRKVMIYLSENNQKPAFLHKVSEITAGFFVFAHLNCEKIKRFCTKKFSFKRFPKLLLFPEEDLLEERFSNSIKYPLSYDDFINKLYLSYGPEIDFADNKNYMNYILASRTSNKVPMVLIDNEERVHPALYILATEKKYKRFLNFIYVKNPDHEVLKQFSAESLPSLSIIIQTDDSPNGTGKLASISTKLTYFNIMNFIDELIIVQQKDEVHEKIYPELMPNFYVIENQNSMNQYCLSTNKPCVLLFLDTAYEKVILSGLKSLLSNPISLKFSFGWIDGLCHKEILTKFNLNEFQVPSAVIFNPKKEAYGRLSTTLSSEKLLELMDATVQGKTTVYNLKTSELIFNPINCKDIPKSTNTQENQKSMMNEIEEL